ncbi:tryptophanase leader peptide [Frederiksenia canicola]
MRYHQCLDAINPIITEKDTFMTQILSPNQIWIIVDPKLSFFFPII